MMYAAVFTLRSIAEISEANDSVDGAAGFASTLLLPLFRLLGLKASFKVCSVPLYLRRHSYVIDIVIPGKIDGCPRLFLLATVLFV